MRVFVGYGGDEAMKVATLLHDHLNSIGRPKFIEFEPFMAPRDTPLGRWKHTVEEALMKTDVFVVVFSLDSASSGNLKKEIKLARKSRVTIHTLLDERIRKNDDRLPKTLRDSGIDHFDVGNPSMSFELLVLKLEQRAFGVPYGGLKIVEAVREA